MISYKVLLTSCRFSAILEIEDRVFVWDLKGKLILVSQSIFLLKVEEIYRTFEAKRDFYIVTDCLFHRRVSTPCKLGG